MRARNIKPSLFKNEVLGTADPLLTILFEGLWCEADRDGRLEDRPLRLKAEIFPYRHNADIDAMLEWLSENGFIARYEAKSAKIIQVLKFSDHQRPHKNEVPSVLPTLDASKHNQGKKRAQPKTQALRSDSPSLIPDSGYLIPDPLMLPSEAMSDAKPPDDVQRVFDHWCQVWNHPRSHLDVKRRALIRRALKGYSADDLCESLSGYQNSPFHMGQNDKNSVYDGLQTLLRDSDQIDKGLRFAREPPELSSKLTQHNVAVLKDWKPPELRNETAGYSEISGNNGELERDFRQRTLPSNH